MTNPLALSLEQQLAAQLTGYLQYKGEGLENLDLSKKLNFVTASNGVFRIEKTPISIFITQVQEFGKNVSIPGLSPLEEGVQLLIPKIPFKYWLQVLSFYKDVYNRDKTEASVLFFWNHDNVSLPQFFQAQGTIPEKPIEGLVEDGQLVIYCPIQKNSSGLSDFKDDGMVHWLRQNCTPLCETHSHHTMNAFWSSTDDSNENMTQFYGVYGNILKDQPDFLFRFVSGDKKINIPYHHLFDQPMYETETVMTSVLNLEGQDPVITEEREVEHHPYNGPWPDVPYPAAWYNCHSVSVTPAWKGKRTTYNYGGANSYSAGEALTGYANTYDFEEGYDYMQGYSYHDSQYPYQDSKKKQVW